MKLTSQDINITTVGCAVLLILAVLLIFVWKNTSGGSLRWIGAGSIAWLAAVLVKGTIGVLFNEPVLGFINSVSGFSGYMIIGSLWLGLLTGLTEVVFGYLIARNRKYILFNQGSGFGLGFGASEAGLMIIAFAALLLIEIYIPGNLPPEALTLITNCEWSDIGFSFLQRILAFAIHISSGIIFVYSLATKEFAFFWLAFVYKSVVDGAAGAINLAGLATKISPLFLILIFVPFSVFGILISIKLYSNWPGKSAPSSV